MAETKTFWRNIALGVVSYLLAFAFLGAGVSKLAGMEMHVDQFAGWGYPAFFLYVVGAVEALAAILIAIPRTRFFGSLDLVVVMLGAVGTHVMAGEFAMLPAPLLLLTLAAVVAVATRPQPMFHAKPQGSAA